MAPVSDATAWLPLCHAPDQAALVRRRGFDEERHGGADFAAEREP